MAWIEALERAGFMRAMGSFDGLTRLWSRREHRLQLAALLAGLGLIIGALLFHQRIEALSIVGYPGVFLLSFLGSVALVLPVPGLISVCTVSVVLAPLVIGLLAGAGETLGETSGYALGYGGRRVVEGRMFYPRMKSWMERRGWLVIFLASVIPNPFFDVVGILAGGSRFPVARFFAIVLVGKTIKGVLVAYACAQGARLLPWMD